MTLIISPLYLTHGQWQKGQVLKSENLYTGYWYMDSRNVIFKIVSKERMHVVQSGTCDTEGNYTRI